MSEITQNQIEDAIKSCMWRKSLHGVYICTGNCNVCFKEIESGRCDTLKRLFTVDKED